MIKPAYYNEIDEYAAQWLRNLITKGLIAPGDVDTRSIVDVKPDDLRPYTQCHFFAGIGVWSHALRRAGVNDDTRVWTGSCPCQPLSNAGKRKGFDDERHLWPHWFHLIEQCRPAALFGEQVASKDAEPWIDLVQDDLEGLGYAVGAVAFPSAGVGAPHIRDRLYWMAYAERTRIRGIAGSVHRSEDETGYREVLHDLSSGGHADGLAYADHGGRESGRQGRSTMGHGATLESDRRTGGLGNPERQSLALSQRFGRVFGGTSGTDAGEAIERTSLHASRLANSEHDGHGGSGVDATEQGSNREKHGVSDGSIGGLRDADPGPTNGFWRAADWLGCRDGKWRPVEPGTLPLANGVTSRVGRLRAYGNAINAEAATIFIEAAVEACAWATDPEL